MYLITADAIYAYLRWKPFLAPSTFYDVLDGAFFHRWLHTLYLWLHSAGAEVQEVYTDVTLWYSEWKGVLPAEVCTDHRVQRHFTTALDMLVRDTCFSLGLLVSFMCYSTTFRVSLFYPMNMPRSFYSFDDQRRMRCPSNQNFAMSEGTVEGFAGGIYALAQAPAASELPSRRGLAADSRAPGTRAPDSVTLSFKDALAMFAEKHGIVFLPTSRVHERSGKPLYSFGSTNVYVDGTLVYAEIGVTRTRPGFADGLFEPVTFEQLLEHENVKDRI